MVQQSEPAGELVTTVDLLRHGDCEGGDIYRGSTDLPLSSLGWRQMQAAVSGAGHWDRCLTSPLRRCRRFAERHAARIGVPCHVIGDFREMHFGQWEGRQVSEVWDSEPATVSEFYRDPERAVPPGGEPLVAVRARVVEAWRQVLLAHSGERLLVLSHRGVIALLLAQLLGMPLANVHRLQLPHASRTRVLVYDHGGEHCPVLHSLNVPGEPQ